MVKLANEKLTILEWKRVNKSFPYGWFFNYYERQVGSSRYFERVNKLDPLFDWICSKLKR